MSEPTFLAHRLDEHGRCCGRKPLIYKTPPAHKFCTRCDAAFDPDSGEQVSNWAYTRSGATVTVRYAETVPTLVRRGRLIPTPPTETAMSDELDGLKVSTHDEAMDFIIGAAGMSTLSYEEAVAVYLRARGILRDGATPMAAPIPTDWSPITALPGLEAGTGGREPDHCYDLENWEYSLPWRDRDDLADEALLHVPIFEVATLLNGPRKFAAYVPVTWDTDGEPDETTIGWFDSREEAEAARTNIPSPPVAAAKEVDDAAS